MPVLFRWYICTVFLDKFLNYLHYPSDQSGGGGFYSTWWWSPSTMPTSWPERRLAYHGLESVSGSWRTFPWSWSSQKKIWAQPLPVALRRQLGRFPLYSRIALAWFICCWAASIAHSQTRIPIVGTPAPLRPHSPPCLYATSTLRMRHCCLLPLLEITTLNFELILGLLETFKV